MKARVAAIAVILAATLFSTGCALYSNVRKVENGQETRVVSVLFLPVYVSSRPVASPVAAPGCRKKDAEMQSR